LKDVKYSLVQLTSNGDAGAYLIFNHFLQSLSLCIDRLRKSYFYIGIVNGGTRCLSKKIL